MNNPKKIVFKVFRGKDDKGKLQEYSTEVNEGMTVLDAMLNIQAESAPDLAFRCNCKAAKCGSCSAEINGKPQLMCKVRISDLPKDKPVTIRALKSFPLVKDLVADVSWNYEVNKRIPGFKPKADSNWRFYQDDVDRVQEFRKCIECFICQNTCHVLRDHEKKEVFFGPRFFVRLAGLNMHPIDEEDRISLIKEIAGIGYCNVTKCCTQVCPEKIKITDNAIIALKERIADRYYDPLVMFVRALFKKKR
jgi:succinate dehydrogenase / fumarate reductase iron-sulfur subunit